MIEVFFSSSIYLSNSNSTSTNTLQNESHNRSHELDRATGQIDLVRDARSVNDLEQIRIGHFGHRERIPLMHAQEIGIEAQTDQIAGFAFGALADEVDGYALF